METFDYLSQFEAMKKNVVASFSKALNIDGRVRQLKVDNVWIDDDLDPEDFHSQHQALRTDKTWGVPVYASLRLVDRATGKDVSTAKKLKVATLPKGTAIGSFIINGKHYQVDNQFRRKAGVYVTTKINGEHKTEINIADKPFDLEQDKDTAIFHLVRKQGRQPLYPILSRMGVSDSAMAKAWGQDVLDANKSIGAKRQASSVKRIAKSLLDQDYDSPDAAASDVRDFLASKGALTPEVTKRTLGEAHDRVTPEVILRGSEELLRTIRGDRKPDDRQSIDYKKIMSVSDLIQKRIDGENSDHPGAIEDLRKKIFGRLSSSKSVPSKVSDLISSNEFTPLFTSFFSKTDLAHTPEQTNPLHILNGLSKITIMGEGGVQNERSIKEEERAVHPSHLGFVDPVHTPESQSIGTVLHAGVGVIKSGQNELKTKIYDPKERTHRYVSPSEFRDRVVAFPDQFRDGKFIDKKVKAMVAGEMRYVDADEVTAVMPSAQAALSISSNAIPFLPSAQGVRGLMATKMLEQAIPLITSEDPSAPGRQAPLVQVKFGNDTTEGMIGKKFSIHAKHDGVIEKISPTKITIKTKDGSVEQPIYNNLPLNTKSFLHAEPRVEVGARVKTGDLLADSNFTAGGELAIGTNLRAAYIPFKGYNFEDGITLTETAAKRLTSQHMYQHAEDIKAGTEISKHKYMAWKKGDLDAEQSVKLDEEGVVRKGQIVKRGDPLWVGVTENKTDPDSIVMSKLVGNKLRPYRPIKTTWEHDADGEVVDVVKSSGRVKVYVKTKEPASIGDKLTNRHGGKGIVTLIIPDGDAPHDAAGKPVDIILNPHGVPSRMNPSQMLETAASKVAEKTGKPYVVDNDLSWNNEYQHQVLGDLAKHGLKNTELLFDPATNKPLGEILTGPQFIMKLSKQATAQFSARAPGDGAYDSNNAPLSGGEEGGKAVDLLSMYSLMAHGARANLREIATVKASRNDQFWHWLQTGAAGGVVKPPPTPSFAYKKFEAYLKGAGVNVKRNGSKFVLQPMTDKATLDLGPKEVKEPLFLRSKDLTAQKGGFLDPFIFGRNEDQWGHLALAEPIPNPIFEDPIRSLTGMDKKKFMGVVAGELFLDPASGQWNAEHRGLTGGLAIQELLKKINVDDALKSWTDKAKTATRPQKLDEANKRIKYLRALKTLNLRPEEAYIQTKIPVLPPQYRKVSVMPNGDLSVAGINNLYRDLGLVSSELKLQNDIPYISDAIKSKLRLDLYQGARAIAGLGNPTAFYPKQRRPSGFLEQIHGDKAKEGFFQQEVLRRNQEPVGRGTIIPEPKLGVDEVGLPEPMAWKIFKPFVIKRMVSLGKPPAAAAKEWEDKTMAARSALDAEMKERPVVLNRAPSLHKFNMLAFNPQIVPGRAVRIPPLVVKGFNADFDGDAMVVHLPIHHDAVAEARTMYPSRNLYNPGTGSVMMQPQNEAALGLYFMSQEAGKPNDPRLLDAIPESLRDKYKTTIMNKKGLTALMSDVAKTEPRQFGRVVDELKKLGDKHAYESGFSINLGDLQPVPEQRAILEKADAAVKRLFSDKKATEKDKQAAVAVIREANDEIDKIVRTKFGGNNLYTMVAAGAKGNETQAKQILTGPVMSDDHHGAIIPVPITRSYGQGLPFSAYWQASYGARRVAIDKQLQTQNPGAFTKDVLASTSTNIISSPDCGTTRGVELPMAHANDLEDRFLARDVRIGGKVVAHAGGQVTTSLVNMMNDHKVPKLLVRSPLTCLEPKGTCAKCYGLHETGQLPAIGENIGAIAGQAISEPLTQMTLRTFHSGGAAGTRNVISGFDKIDKIFKMPAKMPSEATMTTVDGKVSRVEPATGGTGYNVFVADKDHHEHKHFIDKDVHNTDMAHVGKVVEKGDPLSDGIMHPKKLVALKGMMPAQNYMVDEIVEAFRKQGVPLKRRILETVIRSVGNTTRVASPGSSDFLRGDVIPYTVAEHFNASSLGKKTPQNAIGHVLREDVDGAKTGTVIDEPLARTLERHGKHEVEVGPKPIIHVPFLTNLSKVPLFRKDWMSQLGYQHLTEAIVQGAGNAHESDLHGYSPIPAFAYGAEMEHGPKGTY